MIGIQNGVFHLETKNTAYLFVTTPTGHLRHPTTAANSLLPMPQPSIIFPIMPPRQEIP